MFSAAEWLTHHITSHHNGTQPNPIPSQVTPPEMKVTDSWNRFRTLSLSLGAPRQSAAASLYTATFTCWVSVVTRLRVGQLRNSCSIVGKADKLWALMIWCDMIYDVMIYDMIYDTIWYIIYYMIYDVIWYILYGI